MASPHDDALWYAQEARRLAITSDDAKHRFAAAVRMTCLACSYPRCACKAMPDRVRAIIEAWERPHA